MPNVHLSAVKLKNKDYDTALERAAVIVSTCLVAIVPTGNLSCKLLLQGGHELDVHGTVKELVAEMFTSED